MDVMASDAVTANARPPALYCGVIYVLHAVI